MLVSTQGDDDAQRELESVLGSFAGATTRRDVASANGFACDSNDDSNADDGPMDDIMDELASDDDSESDLSDFIFDGVRSTHARLYMFWHWVTSR